MALSEWLPGPIAFTEGGRGPSESSGRGGESAPARTFASFSDTLGRRPSPMHISRLSVGVAVAVLLSGNAIAGALEDCRAAYERQEYATALQPCRPLAEEGDERAQLS